MTLDAEASNSSPPQPGTALATLMGLFAIWGLAQWLYNVLFPHFAQFFALDAAATTGTQALFNIAYCLFAIPSVLFQRQFGYKSGVIFALSGLSLGPFLIYPALTGHAYGFFFMAAILFGAGWSFFETSVNALVVEMGTPANAVIRLNLAQSFYPIGLIGGCYGGLWLLQSNYMLSVGELAPAVARPYVWIGLGILALSFVVDKIRFPAIAIARAAPHTRLGGEIKKLWRRPRMRFAVAAIIANILTQSITWGSTYAYAMQEVPHADGMFSGSMITYSVVILCAGRFLGTAVMRWVAPLAVLATSAALSIVLVSAAALTGGETGLHCLMATSLFTAVFYATIMGTTLKLQGELTKTAAGILVAAAGFAASCAPFLIVATLAATQAKYAVLLALPCLAVVLAYAVVTPKAADAYTTHGARG